MDFFNSIENAIDELKNNTYGIIIKKTKKNMVLTTSIKFPEEILNKEISEMSIEFLLVIDILKPKVIPKLYCISPYCYPHFADGRDIFRELPTSKNPKKAFVLSNILSEILEFIKANFQKGGLNFFGRYYLGSRYDLRMLEKGCNNNNIFYVRENLILNGKSIKQNRVLIVSDVYFLLFEQEKWYKNNLILLFWSSISNIQKIQKVKDSKTLLLQWSQKEKETYVMSLTMNQRDNFISFLLDKMHKFGMMYDVKKIEENLKRNMVNNKPKDFESQNRKLIDDNEEEENYNEEEEEEEDDDEEEKEKEKEENDKDAKDNNVNDKEEKDNNLKDEKDENINNKENQTNGDEGIEQNKENITLKENNNVDKEEIKDKEIKQEENEKIDNIEEIKNEKEVKEIPQEEKKDEIKEELKEDKNEEKKEEIREEIKEEKIEEKKDEINEEQKEEKIEEKKDEINEEQNEEKIEEKKEETNEEQK